MQATRPRFGEGDHRDLPEWQEAARFASAVEELSQALELPSELEWLRFLLGRSGSAIAPLIEQAWQSEFLAEYLLGLYESLDHVLLLEYYLLFLRGEELMARSRVDALDAQRQALQDVILGSAAGLRQTWAEEFQGGALGAPPHLGPLPTC